MKIRNTLLLSTLLVFTGCAELLNNNRSFVDQMDHETDGFFVAGRDFESVPGDSGKEFRSKSEIGSRTPASRKERERFDHIKSIKSELARKERALSPKEYGKYRKYKRYMKTDSDRVYYLGLPSYDRDEYLAGLVPNYYHQTRKGMRHQLGFQRQIRRSELYVGMSKNAVINNWKRPTTIEVAGDPRNENERWVYRENGKNRFVYFENGRVEGWTMDHASQNSYYSR